jgi:hypothetical protein
VLAAWVQQGSYQEKACKQNRIDRMPAAAPSSRPIIQAPSVRKRSAVSTHAGGRRWHAQRPFKVSPSHIRCEDVAWWGHQKWAVESMLSKIDRDRYAAIKVAARERIFHHPLINAVLSLAQHGHVYRDASGESFFVSTKSGFCLYHSRTPTPEFDHELVNFLLCNESIPPYIHIYCPTESLKKYLARHWTKYKIRPRAQFRYYRREMTYGYKALLPPGYQIVSVQEIDFVQLEQAFKLDFGSRYWDSIEDFVKNAIGACILNETGEPVAICYSACIVDGIAEMDTLVLDDYRGRKFMRIVSEPFFNMAITRGLVPHWDTFVSNTASYVMAQKLGLKAVQEYDLLSVFLR